MFWIIVIISLILVSIALYKFLTYIGDIGSDIMYILTFYDRK